MKVVAYTRGTAGVRGSAESLSFWRRVRLPQNQLRVQGTITSFEVHDLGMHEHLSSGMLMGPDVVVLHNLFPREEEIPLLKEVHTRMMASGHVPAWVYDLEIPSLLQEEEVLEILPLMRLITVPNLYLQEEVETLSRSFQPVEITPSTYDLEQFYRARSQVRVEDAKEETFVLGCLGPHDWSPFLHGLFEQLYTHLPFASWSSLRVVTDSHEVSCHCKEWGVRLLGEMVDTFQPASYPRMLARCSVGLLPRDGQNGEDYCWLWEYGAMGIPCIAATGSTYEQHSKESSTILLPLNSPDAWAKQLVEWTTKKGKESYQQRSSFGYRSAILRRVALIGPVYARIYRQILPISPDGF